MCNWFNFSIFQANALQMHAEDMSSLLASHTMMSSIANAALMDTNNPLPLSPDGQNSHSQMESQETADGKWSCLLLHCKSHSIYLCASCIFFGFLIMIISTTLENFFGAVSCLKTRLFLKHFLSFTDDDFYTPCACDRLTICQLRTMIIFN